MCPLNFQPELTHPRALQTNQRAVERHLTFDHYVRPLTPGAFIVDGTNCTHALVTAASNRWPALAYADAATGRAIASFRKPSEWRGGQLVLRFWYTAPGSSTNNFAVLALVNSLAAGEVLNGTLLLNTGTVTVAGPGTANTLLRSTDYYSSTPLGNDDELFAVQLIRLGADAGDTNTNALHVLHVEVQCLPLQQVAQ